MSNAYALTVILPTYNEAENIRLFIPAIETAFAAVHHEIVLVDDNSTDGTRDVAAELHQRYGNIRVLHRMQKMGIGSALRDGYNDARSDVIISSDADLSFCADDLRRLYDHLLSTPADLVLGCRHKIQGCAYEALGYSIGVKRSISGAGNWILRTLSGLPIHDFSANCRAIRKNAWEKLDVSESGNIMLFEMILKANYYCFSVMEIPVAFTSRKYGVSKLRLSREIPRYLARLMFYIVKYCWSPKKINP